MLPLIFAPQYACGGMRHFQRLVTTHARAADLPGVCVHHPQALPVEALHGLHDPGYVQAVLEGIPPLAAAAYLPWSTALVDGVLHMLGGQVLGTQLARQHGIAVNIACGFHHAWPQRGGGFCIFNGLALIAHLHPQWQVMVLDCDEHGGDGTEAFCSQLPNLHAVSLYGTRFGLRGEHPRSHAIGVPRVQGGSDVPYLEALDTALELIRRDPPDLVLYQASADTHRDDPRASLRLSDATLAERDRRVFGSLRTLQVPVLVTLAGGYQEADRVSDLYLRTVQTALDVLRCVNQRSPLS